MFDQKNFDKTIEDISQYLNKSQELFDRITDEKYDINYILEEIETLDKSVTKSFNSIIGYFEEVSAEVYRPIAYKLESDTAKFKEDIASLENELEDLEKKIKTYDLDLENSNLVAEEREIIIDRRDSDKELYELLSSNLNALRKAVPTLGSMGDFFWSIHKLSLKLSAIQVEQSDLISTTKKEKIKRHLVEIGKNLVTDSVPFWSSLRKINELVSGVDIEASWVNWDREKKEEICTEMIKGIQFKILLIPSVVEGCIESINSLLELGRMLFNIDKK